MASTGFAVRTEDVHEWGQQLDEVARRIGARFPRSETRDRVRAALQERGVQTAVHYPKPVHLQEGLEHLGYKEGSLPNTERACQRVMSMPLFPEMTVEQVRHAASSLREIVGTRS